MKKDKISLPFKLIIAYLFFEYVRPQSLIPGLSVLHIPALIQLALIFCLFKYQAFNFNNFETKCFLALIVLMILHVPFAINNYWAFQTTIIMIKLVIVYLSFVSFIKTPKELDRIMFVFILVGFFCAIHGNIKGGMIPGSAFMGDENDFALVLNMIMPIAFFKALYSATKKMKILFMFAFFFLILGTVASMSRGGFVGLCAAISYCWLRGPKKIITGIVMIIIIVISLNFISQEYWDEIDTIKTTIQSQQKGQRQYYWSLAWRMFLQHPFIGVGPNNFPWVMHLYEPTEGHAGRFHRGKQAHSIFFTLISELGLVGIFLFIGMLFKAIKDEFLLSKYLKFISKNSTFKKNINDGFFINNLKIIHSSFYSFDGALFAYFATGTFLSVFYYPHFWLFIGIIVARNNIAREIVIKNKQYFEKASRYEVKKKHD